MTSEQSYHKMMSYETQEALTFIENVDLTYLKMIVTNFDKCYDKLGDFKEEKNNFKKLTDKASIHTKLKNRLKNKDNKFTYKPSRVKEGRIYSDTWSLCGMNKIIRCTLAKDLNYDIDIVNAHPTFLVWFCNTQSIKCSNMEKYCLNRNEFLKDVANDMDVTTDQAKIQILSMINDQNLNFDPNHSLYSMYQEIRTIQDHISKFDKKSFDRCKRNKPENPKGSCTSYFLQNIENKILQCMIQFCYKNKIRISAPCFDGFLAYKDDCDNYDLEKLLKDLEGHVSSSLDINIQLSEKKLDKDICQYLNDLHFSSNSSVSSRMSDEDGAEYFDDSLTSDYTLAKVILEELYEREIFYYNKFSNRCYIYDEKKCLFVENKIEVVSALFNKLIKPYYEKIDLYNYRDIKYNSGSMKTMLLARRYLDMSYGVRNVFNYLKLLLNVKDDSEIINNKFDKNPDLFPFGLYVYDFKLNIVRLRTKNDFITMTTNNSFFDDFDENYVRQYIKDILKTDDDAYVDCFSLLIGYFLTGYNNLKKFVMFSNPSGNNGKSVFLELISSILDFYCIPTPDKVFISHKFDGSSTHQTHMFPLIGKRLVHMVEPDAKQKLNVDLIKKITGDDKFHNIRRCGGDANETVSIDCKLLLICNDCPGFDDEKSFNNRILNINFANKFENNPKKKEEILSHKNDFFSYFCIFAHKFIENGRNIDFVKQMISSSKEVIDNNDTILDFIQNNYQITNNRKDRILKCDLWENYRIYSRNSNNAITGKIKFYKAFNDRYNLEVYKKISYYCIKKIEIDEVEVDHSDEE